MKKSLALLALALPGMAGAQHPYMSTGMSMVHSPDGVSGMAGLYSQYMFRGLTQTNARPALQGELNWNHLASGFYAGVWGSNASWFEETNVGTLPGTTPGPVRLGQPTDPFVVGPFAGTGAPGFNATGGNSNSLQVDFYGGWKRTWGDWGLDVGLLRYWYPGHYNNLGGYFSKPNTLEAFGGVSWRWFRLKYFHALSDAFGVKDSRGSGYLDVSAHVPLGGSGFTLGLHAGHQRYRGNSPMWAFMFGPGMGADNGVMSYSDYRVSLEKEGLGFLWRASLTGTDARARATFGGFTMPVWENVHGRNLGKSALTLSVEKMF